MNIFNIHMGGGKSSYRSDIDGLRAIACLSVVIYHAFPTVLIGGFTGVDIFFVISGFLISSILFRELSNPHNPGKINIIDFYIRRIRRIFPALIAVLITCLALGYFVLFPDEYGLLGKHTAGGSVYINNIILYKESGNYFDVSSSAKPLLHLWSLGVEEQFYLVFPLLLWILYKLNINFIFGLTVFTVISFICNKNAINHSHQTAAFYLPQFRFWELSIGAILAYVAEYHKEFIYKFKSFSKETLIKKICLRDSNIVIKDNTLNNLLSTLGIFLIIIGILTVKQNLKFPGTKALIPVLGALFIIAAGKEAFINKKILSNKVMVFLGLISYPLYLWHWPLLSFSYICSGKTPEVFIRAIALCAALILSIITYLFIEPRLRFGKLGKLKASLLLCLLCLCGGIGLYIQQNNGIENRLTKYDGLYFNKDKFVNLIDSNNKEYFNECQKKINGWIDTSNYYHTRCYLTHSTEYQVAFIGDSQVAEVFYGTAQYLPSNIGLASFSAFPLFPHNLSKDDNSNYLLAKEFIKKNSIKLVILGNYYKSGYSDEKLLFNELIMKVNEILSENKKVLFLLKHPYLKNDYGANYFPSICSTRPFGIAKNQCEFKESELLDNNKDLILFRKVIINVCSKYPKNQVDYFDELPLFCKEGTCSIKQNGVNTYYDEAHVNHYGSLFIGKDLSTKIVEMLKQ